MREGALTSRAVRLSDQAFPPTSALTPSGVGGRFELGALTRKETNEEAALQLAELARLHFCKLTLR